MTQVINLRTGETAVYRHRPHVAVRIAHREHLGADSSAPRRAPVVETETTVACGEWAALRPERLHFRRTVPGHA